MASESVFFIVALLLSLATASYANVEEFNNKAVYSKPVAPAPTPAVKPKPLPTPAPTVKPPTPVTKPPAPPPAPSPPVVVKPPAPSPPATAPLPPVRSRADCVPLCAERCKLHSRQNRCARACETCCDRCKCVPPGTYGNRERCGKCYTSMTTRNNKPKCP